MLFRSAQRDGERARAVALGMAVAVNGLGALVLVDALRRRRP